MKIYCKFTVEYACKKIKTGQHLATGKKAYCLAHSVCLGTVLLKYEDIAR